MNRKRWIKSFVALLCLLCMTAGLFSGCGKKNKIEVQFDMNWKEAASTPESITVKKGKPYGTLPQINADLREGYTFGGWYLDADCEGEEVTADTIVTKEVSHILYAKWIGDKVTVSFDLQGGTINGVSTVEDAVVTVGNVYSMMAIPEDPERENHSFLGWYYDPEGTEGPIKTSTKVEKTEDHTIYAVWQEYKLFYDFTDGDGLEVFAAVNNVKYSVEHFNGSEQLCISNPGTDKADGAALQMWLPLKTGTRVTMDVTFDGALASEDARMYIFGYGLSASGMCISDGTIDITLSETHRKWYHGNGYRAMQKDGVWYYGDEGNWKEGNSVTFEMIVMEDCSGLYFNFCLGSGLEPTQFVKNHIYIDNIEVTPNYYRELGEGMMGSSINGATDKGIYFTMKDNGLPYDSDWNIYYSATAADNVKLIRNGQVYAVAQTDCHNICKFSPSDYYLRLEDYTIGAAAPISNSDMFIVEGDFRNGNDVLTIVKCYIYHDGEKWVFADFLPEELAPVSENAVPFPDPYAGILRSHEYGATEQGIYFLLSDNGLPYGDWDTYYDATTEDNVKIIRDGKVYCIAQVGCDNICKFGKADYYLKLEPYTIGTFAPISTDDIFILEGEFVYEDSVLDIPKTYVYYDGAKWVFTTELPAELKPDSEEPVKPEGLGEGVIAASSLGATEQGIYFIMDDNELPYGDWDTYYDATSDNCVRMIRDGKVYAVAVPNTDNICKFGKTNYYLKLEPYTIGNYAPISTDDIFIVEGDFTFEEHTLTIAKCYIYHDGEAWVFTDELPEELKPETEELADPTGLEDGEMGKSPLGAGELGIYFEMKDNGLPYGDWDTYYDATSDNCVRIIRDGKVYAVAVPNTDNICKFGKTSYYLRLEPYTIGSYAPFSTDDIIIVEGDFTFEEHTLTIAKCYIYHDGEAWVFTDELPEELKPETEELADPTGLEDGEIGSSTLGVGDLGIYFTMKDNGLPYGDWNVYYNATGSANVQIIRDGKLYNAAQVDCDNICKFGKTDYYLRLENYTIGGYAPYTTDDVIIVEGDFTYEDETLTIVKTYIYYDGFAWIFSQELPEELQPEETEQPSYDLGALSSHNDGVNISGGNVVGIYATAQNNIATYNSDWSVEYTPVKAENYQLIRGGVSYNIGVTGAGTFVLFGQTELYLKQESHTVGDGSLLPIRDGDILVVKGEWRCNQDASCVVTVDPTYITVSNSTATFSTTAPEGVTPDEGGEDEADYNMGALSSHNGGVNISGGNVVGIYAIAQSNDAIYNSDWSVEYTPVKAENYQLIRGGVSYNIGAPGEGTFVLFSQTELYLKQESHTVGDGSLLPIRDGDILVVKGEWRCNQDASCVVTVDPTYITVSNSTATFSTTAPEGVTPDEGGEDEADYNMGALSSHNGGVNISGGNVVGIYAIAQSNDAIYNSDWSVEYTPVKAENYQLIRGGVSYNIGVTGEGTFVLFGQTELYLKQESHTVGDGSLLPIRDGDILVVKGEWRCNQDTSCVVTVEPTYITVSNSAATFSAAPVEDDTEETVQWPFTFDDGVVSTEIFKLGESDLTMTVEEFGDSMQLKLQPSATNGTYRLWLDQDLTAGTVITLDVTFQRKLGTMNLYLYGADENGDPITEGTVSDTVPQEWFDGQGMEADFSGGNTNTQSITFTVYEDCHGVCFMLDYSNKKPNVIYLDNIMSSNAAGGGQEGDLNALLAHSAGVNVSNSIIGIYATVAANNALFNTDWSVEYTPAVTANYQLIRDGVTYDIGNPGEGTLVLFGQTEAYLKQESHTVGDGSLLPIRDGDILIVSGLWNCNQDANSSLQIGKTYIQIQDGMAYFYNTDPRQ